MSQPPRLEPLAAVTTLEEKDDGDKNKEHSEKEHERVNSPSTDSSSGSQTEAGTVSPQENTGSSPPKLKWYRRLNPLRLRTPPPVPKERITSRERDAGILSVMTFQWMSPLMMVCRPSFFFREISAYGVYPTDNQYRLAIYDRYNYRTSGW